ncbi:MULTISPECIES: alanine dehydrogenase [Brachybacterium]|uniref:Alanine dehydrogenase n=1 Tax=Brachybacterium alimentarium TaxID=47845 RepID=A0A2A3YFA3_9MICO|nr:MULTISPECIES: alanine dehydrogenase [Brachybacterium]PCC36174.1 alanine dehydrogenase [Brachybacterium alimentarium]PCC37948.1 alanine dehydrogenase [Brachybacterium alimentarium]RCS67071.1 alanine dehydrogenase [Brachybacterium sp. JB7]RCS68515.1 alanine dehydrogenase [Brachybacterium alimentarium]RCS75582.1 alanine dehydrogenase [Brachybacterium alimentarium]
MRIGVPKEIKNNENRVGLTAAGVHELAVRGHDVVVESGAGSRARISDEDYRAADARVLDSADEIWEQAELIVKVKEPLAAEYGRMRRGQVLLTYLHLAADADLTEALLSSGVTSIAYETVQLPSRALPLLAPMSMIAGRLATQVAAYHLMAPLGGSGVLMGGVPGTDQANVLILGGGMVGEQAAVMAHGLHANVTVMDLDVTRLGQIATMHHGGILTRYSTTLELAEQIREADVVVGSVLVPGKRAPKLVTDEMVATMKPGSVLVDVAIDQGGCFEGSRPTTHDDPTFAVHDSVYYCVANMPGSVPVTATSALTNATLPYVLKVADAGWRDALRADEALAKGLHTHEGALTHAGTGEAHGLEVTPAQQVIG